MTALARGVVPGEVDQRGGRQDQTRIELDVRSWLDHYTPFDLADPFAK